MGVWIQRAKHCHPRLLRTHRQTKQEATWTPSARRCRASRARQTACTPPSRSSRMPLKRATASQIRRTVTFVIMAKKCTALRLSLTKPTTNSKKPPNLLRRRTNTIRRLSPMCQPFPVESCWHRDKACKHFQGSRQHPEESEGCGVHLHEQ